MSYRNVAGLRVEETLYSFVEEEGLPIPGLSSDRFWSGVRRLVEEFTPRIRAALEARRRIQGAIDSYHGKNKDPLEHPSYKRFLERIGYFDEDPGKVTITTSDVDPEISRYSGPQLVTPLLNARFAINAANARWGSLYDALYGSDMIAEENGAEKSGAYNPVRGARVIEWAASFLDKTFPLDGDTHAAATKYYIAGDRLLALTGSEIQRSLADQTALVGYVGEKDAPSAIVLRQNNLHVILEVDRTDAIGQQHPAGVKDIVLESALTTIMDLEDAVATVDGEDKSLAYHNWLGLLLGNLECAMNKGAKTFTRVLSDDFNFSSPDGVPLTLPGRSVMMVRHVGHHMFTDAILDGDAQPTPEGVIDAVMTGLAYKRSLLVSPTRVNSRTGSFYVVKPKMHSANEVRITVDLLSAVERLLEIPSGSTKLGVMDEERRLSVNLRAAISEAADRIMFINTGFLDRTGGEIHTSLYAGPVVRKNDMKQQKWISAYEQNNVLVGIQAGMPGHGQIGKGMWPMPDEMRAMYEQKKAHLLAGANCAWVPSPTAATIHALHYHEIDVGAIQRGLARRSADEVQKDLLTLPLLPASPAMVRETVRQELENNVQGILGYTVRWVNSGVGCSKIPDIRGISLMEDRATCRISSQHIANWLIHGIIDVDDVEKVLRAIAHIVDEQNGNDPDYEPLAEDFSSPAFLAAKDIALDGRSQDSGYVDAILTRYRKLKKHGGVLAK